MKKVMSIVIFFCLVLGMAGCSSNSKSGTDSGGNGSSSNVKIDSAAASKYEGKPEMKYVNAGLPVPYEGLDLGGREIVVAAWWDPSPGERGTNEAIDLQYERFDYLEQQYHCKFVFRKTSQADIITRIQTSVESGTSVFDAAWVNSSDLPVLAMNNYLYNLSDIKAYDFSDPKWNQTMIKKGTLVDKKYGFSWLIEPGINTVMVFNKEMFKKNGWPDLYDLVDKKEWTFDKLREIAQMATDKASGRSGVVGSAFMFRQYMYSNNAECVSFDETGKPSFTVDSANAIEGFQHLLDLKYKYQVIDEPESATWDYFLTAFKEGKAAMSFTQYYLINEQLGDMKDDFGVIPPPMGPKATEYSSVVINSPVMVMPANNPQGQEVGFILDLVNEPYPGHEDLWKIEPESFLRDNKSVEIVKYMSDNCAVLDNMVYFPSAYNLLQETLVSVWRSESTLAEGLSKIKTQSNQLMNDVYKGWTKAS